MCKSRTICLPAYSEPVPHFGLEERQDSATRQTINCFHYDIGEKIKIKISYFLVNQHSLTYSISQMTVFTSVDLFPSGSKGDNFSIPSHSLKGINSLQIVHILLFFK